MKTILVRAAVALVVSLTLDLGSKYWVEQLLPPYSPVPVIGDLFRLTLGYNTGVAFGMFANGGNLPLFLTGFVIIALTVWISVGLRKNEFPPAAGWAIGMLLGGALGNFLDRLPDGSVVDFLDAGIGDLRWYTFNLADCFILAGLVLLMLFEMQRKPTTPTTGPDLSSIESSSES